MSKSTNAVALVVASESELVALAARLGGAGIRFAAIRESDGPHAGQLMAIGCAPGPREHVRRFMSSYPLLR